MSRTARGSGRSASPHVPRLDRLPRLPALRRPAQARPTLAGSHVLITGAGRGIGRLLAIGAATRGARAVTLWDLDETALAEASARVAALGATVRTRRVDVTDPAAVTAAVDAAVDACGPVDILVNNAGIVVGKPFLDTTRAEVERTYAVNTFALYDVTRAVLPSMLERDRGLIVTVASAAGLVGVARQTDYSGSKFAAVGFTEALRSELRADGSSVSTLTVCPYYVSTGMFEGVTTRFPRLLPIQEPRVVATQILKAIETGRARLVTPPFAATIYAARLVPVALADRILDAFGLNHGMDRFVGRR